VAVLVHGILEEEGSPPIQAPDLHRDRHRGSDDAAARTVLEEDGRALLEPYFLRSLAGITTAPRLPTFAASPISASRLIIWPAAPRGGNLLTALQAVADEAEHPNVFAMPGVVNPALDLDEGIQVDPGRGGAPVATLDSIRPDRLEVQSRFPE
jgi:hypothetical protein